MKQDQLDKMADVVSKADHYKTWIGRLLKWQIALKADVGLMGIRASQRSSDDWNEYVAVTPDCMKADLIAACDKAIKHYETKLEELSYVQK